MIIYVSPSFRRNFESRCATLAPRTILRDDVAAPRLLRIRHRRSDRQFPQRRHPSLSARRVDRVSCESLSFVQRADSRVRQHSAPQLCDSRRALPLVLGADLAALSARRARERALLSRHLRARRTDDRVHSDCRARVDDDRADLHRCRGAFAAERDHLSRRRDRIRDRIAAPERYAQRVGVAHRLGRRRGRRRRISARRRARVQTRAAHRRNGTRRREDDGDGRRGARMAGRARSDAGRLRRRRSHRRSDRAAHREANALRAAVRRVPRLRHADRSFFRPYSFAMVDRAAPPALTKLGFRRDVRLFLSVLVSFLALLIVVLIALLQTFAYDYEEATMERWNAIADAGAHEIGSARNLDDAMLRANLLLARYDLARVTVQIDGVTRDTTSHRKPRESETIRRAAGNGNVTFVFDATTSRSRERLFRYSAAICFAAAVCGIVLLLFYLPRITRPIELLLDQAKTIGDREAGVGDEAYLIETFRNTIDTMKRQEIELHRLHDLQKSRADDLERVTAALPRSLSSGVIAADADGRETTRQCGGEAYLIETFRNTIDTMKRQEIELHRLD